MVSWHVRLRWWQPQPLAYRGSGWHLVPLLGHAGILFTCISARPRWMPDVLSQRIIFGDIWLKNASSSITMLASTPNGTSLPRPLSRHDYLFRSSIAGTPTQHLSGIGYFGYDINPPSTRKHEQSNSHNSSAHPSQRPAILSRH